MPANLKNSAVARGVEKVSFHSNPKEWQCQRMLKLSYNCAHFTHKEIEGNRGKTRELFKKIGDIRGKFHAKMITMSIN